MSDLVAVRDYLNATDHERERFIVMSERQYRVLVGQDYTKKRPSPLVHHPHPRSTPWEGLQYKGAEHHVFVITSSEIDGRWLGRLTRNPVIGPAAWTPEYIQYWVTDIRLAQAYAWEAACYTDLPSKAAWQALGVRIFLEGRANKRVAQGQRPPAINRRTHVDWSARDYQRRKS